MNDFLCKANTIFEIWYNFHEKGVPMKIDVKRLHIKVNHINYSLFSFILMMFSLLLIVLELYHLGLFKRILVVKNSLNQLWNAVFLVEG